MATMNSTWLTNPQDSDTPSFGDNEIRGTRLEFHDRLTKEHVIGGATAADGAHKKGVARAYYQAAAPSLRPDGSSSLDSDDDGRLFVDSDTDTLQVWDGSAMADLTVNTATTAMGVNDGGGGGDLLCKILEIGTWDMDVDIHVNVAHGLTYTKIRAIMTVTIRLDDDSERFMLDYIDAFLGPSPGGDWHWDATNVTLYRVTGGIFDSPSLSTMGGDGNRGWIMLWYIA